MLLDTLIILAGLPAFNSGTRLCHINHAKVINIKILTNRIGTEF